jgi:hypothetical protein
MSAASKAASKADAAANLCIKAHDEFAVEALQRLLVALKVKRVSS